MKSNGLKHSSKNTDSIILADIITDADFLDKAPSPAWFIAYLDHRVAIGTFSDGKLNYFQDEIWQNDVTLKNIQKMRIFNPDEELFLWRTALGGYKARIRKDGSGKEQDVIDANQVIFGTEAKPSDNGNSYSILTESRGTEIILPMKELGINNSDIDNKKGRLCIHTRSYIGYIEETGQATIEDVRFVEFKLYREE